MVHLHLHLRCLAVAVAISGAAAGAQAAAPITLTSPSVEWPSGDRVLPPGPGVETVSANCVACHSAGMILNQPALSKTTWDTEVHKMVNVYKAPVAEKDVGVIVDYLVAIRGAK